MFRTKIALAKCWCDHEHYLHVQQRGRCLACPCVGFKVAVNRNHRHGIKNAQPQRTEYNGTVFDSKAESNYAAGLDWRLKVAEIDGWKYHPLIHIEMNGDHICDYEIDFVIFLKDGWREYVETKGSFFMRDPVWRLKWKMANAYFKNEPKVRLTLVPV